MSRFHEVKEEFITICETHCIAVPRIEPALESDVCDYTDPDVVRIKPVAGLDPDYHAAHLFGHYICGLHDVNDEKADYVADLIASLV